MDPFAITLVVFLVVLVVGCCAWKLYEIKRENAKSAQYSFLSQPPPYSFD